ncbi:MAG: hypothetical protein AAF086_00730 [Planctomycetota bacterium]
MKPSENPFRSGCVNALGYVSPSGEPWESIVSRVRAAGFRGALVGPHGHGKSTLMAKLATLDPPAGAERHDVVQVMADGSNVRDVKRDIAAHDGRLFIDGYDLLPWRLRATLRQRREVIVTSHRDTRLPTLVRCETTPALLGELVGRLSPSVRAGLGDDGVAVLHRRHAGNIRDALRELYDRVATGAFSL